MIRALTVEITVPKRETFKAVRRPVTTLLPHQTLSPLSAIDIFPVICYYESVNHQNAGLKDVCWSSGPD